MKNKFKIFGFLYLIFCLTACSQEPSQEFKIEEFSKKGIYQTKTLNLNNIEYKQLLNGSVGKYGGKLVLGLSGNGPKTFNCWASTENISSSVSGLMFSGLVERDPWTGEIVPSLAKSYEIKDGGKKIIVSLRKNILWSDGKPITSHDVIFTWNTIIKQGFERLGNRETIIVEGEFPEVKALDKYTISISTKRVFAPLLGELSYPIAPAHFFEPILEKAGGKLSPEKALEKQKQIFSTIWGSNLNPKTMVVSGPFKLSSYSVGERIEYEANPNYFVFDKKGNRLPYLKKFVYLIMPSDDLEIFKFASGEIPMMSISPETLPLIQKIKIKKPFSIYNQGPSQSTTFVAFNMSRKGAVPKHISKWFNNKNFRTALALATNRQALIDSVFQGIGSPLCFSTSEISIYFDKSLKPFCSAKPNLEKAQTLLKQAGFTKNKNGELIDPEGNLVHFTLYTNAGSATDTNSPRELMAILLKEQWQKLGIKLDLKVIEFNNLVVRLMQTGDWEVVIMGLTGGDLFEPNSSANVLFSDSRLHIFDQRPQGQKVTDKRPWEAEIDNALIQGTASMSFEQRKNYYYRIQKILWEESPLIYLATPQTLLAVQKDNIGNFMPSQLAGATHNLEQWYYKN